MKKSKIFAGDRLRRLRDQHAMTQTALAEALEISAGYLSQIEADQRPITRELLLALTQMFSLQAGDFADEDDLRLATELRETASAPLFRTAVSISEPRAPVSGRPG